MDLVTLLNLDRRVESMFEKKPEQPTDGKNRPLESEPLPPEPLTREAK